MREPLKMYTVRRTGEYLIQVFATDEDSAVAEAEGTEMDDWDMVDLYPSRAEEG